MKKVFAVLLVLVISLSITYALAADRIGVSMPAQSQPRWDQAGAYMKAILEEAGFEADLQFADDDAATQAAQLEAMIAGGCKVLVIAPVDGGSLGAVLAKAKAQNIPVIAYDRLILDTDAVSYYVTFDSYTAGTIHGRYIESLLDLKNAAGPFHAEILFGDPSDNDAPYIYQGIMDVLSPYFDSGKLVIPSGQRELEAVTLPASRTGDAKARMDSLIATFYTGGAGLDAVLCVNDSVALGVSQSLAAAGFEEFPIITGQDCDIANIRNIIAGKQSMSIFRDTRDLTEKAAGMVQAIMKGEQPEVNDTTTYNNNVLVVPAFLCASAVVDENSYRLLLIESGYYTEDQLK